MKSDSRGRLDADLMRGTTGMKPDLAQLVKTLEKKTIDLAEYQNYLRYTQSKKLRQITLALNQRKVSLQDFSEYLVHEAQSLSLEVSKKAFSSRQKNWFKNVGLQFLNSGKIELSELNQILYQLEPGPQCAEKFLQQMVLLQKIKIEEFIPYLKFKHYVAKTEEPEMFHFRLLGGKMEFYLEDSVAKKQIGSYFILDELGRGGMGVVYKAYHPTLNRTVALKLLLAGELASEKILKRFVKESQVMAKLNHPGIMQILDSGQDQGRHYFVMEYVEGTTLDHRLKQGVKIRESVRWIQLALEALEHAHQHGVVHRDLKLGNLFLTPNQDIKIGDFGLAKDLLESDSQKLTHSGAILGTSNYLSPEQAAGYSNKIDPRADIYALGICLYRLLTKKFPFNGESMTQLLNQILQEEPLPPSKHNPKIHKDLDHIILKAIEKVPDQRYLTAKKFAEDLEHFLEGMPVEAKSLSVSNKARRWYSRNRRSVYLWFPFFLCVLCLPFFVQGYWLLEKKNQRNILYLQALEEKSIALKINQNHFASYTQKIHHLLRAFELLRQIQQNFAVDSTLREEFWNVGKHLVSTTCEAKSFQFAEYFIREMKSLLSFSTPEFETLQKQIDQQQEKTREYQKKRFQYWVHRLQLTSMSQTEQQDAIFEISKMSEPEIFAQLLQFLHHGTQYFLESASRSKHQDVFYSVMAQSLGRLGNKKAIFPLFSAFEQISQKILKIPVAQRKREDVDFMVVLFHALGHLEANQVAESMMNIRHQMPQGSLFWEKTELAYQKLSKSAGLSNKASFSAKDYSQRGLLKLQEGNFDGAVQDFSQVLILNPTSSFAYVNRGVAKKKLGQFNEAIEDYTKAIQIDKNCSDAYLNRGLAYFHKNMNTQALEDYHIVIRLDPSPIVFYNRGLVWARIKKFKEAIEDFNRSLQIDPQYRNAYIDRGLVYFQLKEFDLAKADYNQALLLDPKEYRSYLYRGVLKRNMGDLDGAIQDYDETIRLNPKAQDAYSNRANAKDIKGDYAGAISDFSTVFQHNPQEFSCIYHLGRIKLKLKDTEGAKEHFRQYLDQTKQQTHSEALQFRQNIFNIFPELRQ